MPSEKEPDQTAQPKRKQNRIHDLGLIENERDWTTHHIAMRLPDVVHQFEKRKVVANQPDQIGQKNQERDGGADPKLLRDQKSALAGQDECDYDGENEKRYPVLGFHSETDQNPEPDPVTRIVAVDRTDDAPDAARPNERLECVHCQPVVHHEITRHTDHRQRGQHLGENAAAHFASYFAGHPNGRGTGERREKPQTNDPLAKEMPRDPRDERDQRRLIDISPIEVLAAGQVIKFVAENSVTVRSEEMEN